MTDSRGLSVAVRAALLGLATILASCGATPSPTGREAASGTALEGSPSASARASASPGSPSSPAARGPDRVTLVALASGLASPIGITNAGDGSGRLFVNEQAGVVRVIGPGGSVRKEPFLDVRDRVLSGGERGLLGLAFHPGFPQSRRIYVDYTRQPDGATVISEFRATSERADPATEAVVLVIPQPFANHNGGQLAFGPDGDLYVGMGDGGSGGDPQRNGQNTRALLGKILRIDVDSPRALGMGYAIPADNPFATGGVRPGQGAPEVWAYGLRNPWRFSFDPRNGDMYIGDVGQGAWEEIDRQPGDSRGGENYGWNVMEGRHCYGADSCDQQPYVKPIAEYGHDAGCAVTGGYVYRGTRQPALVGTYLFGDYCSGTIFSLQVDGGTITPKQLLSSGKRISSFGVGEDGEVYLADVGGGGIYRVVAG
jgi:glucose/arabinose dehydrogenase